MSLKNAMVLAAGFGTRLKPITLQKPKALVKINNIPMIDILFKRLVSQGIEHIVINSHHFSEQIIEHINNSEYNNVTDIITEKEILGTGGGILNAKKYLKDTGCFLVHNVDVISDIDIHKLYQHHISTEGIGTLAVQHRTTSRSLILDESGLLIGRKNEDQEFLYTDHTGKLSQVGFTGIHIVSDKIFELMTETGFFDIFTSYFRLIKNGYKFYCFNADSYHWKETGSFNKKDNFS